MVEGTMQGKPFSKKDKFLFYSRTFDKPADIIHEKRMGIEKRDGSIAFPLNQNRGSAGKVFAYLPVRSDTGLPFLIHADFILPSSREEILDIRWNRWLMDCIANLAAYALSQLKNQELLTFDLLEALASSMQKLDERSIYYPIVHTINDAFNKEELLPADDGSFTKAQSAKIARSTDLRGLLNPDQLRLLFKISHEVKWLSAEITEFRTPNLRLYLIRQLGIEEVRPEKFVDLLTDDFLETQTDKWIIAFYSFLGKDRTELWKKPDAALRKKKNYTS